VIEIESKDEKEVKEEIKEVETKAREDKK